MNYGTILITGGTGTFGNAFTRRVLDEQLAERIIILSRDEVKQAQMKARFDDRRLGFIIGDVRDREKLYRAFLGIDCIVHAASLKQLQRSGEEADEFFKTVCIGAWNVIEAAHAADVKKVVALSTDKACAASTPYGIFKGASEVLFVHGNTWGPCRFACTRYGNILGSRGSVLELWNKQAVAGQPLTITDDRMTRFWMTISEAVDLVLLALSHMGGGEIFIPKDVWRYPVIALASYLYPGAEVVVGEKRSYEKIHEALVSPEEVDRLHDCGDVYVLAPLHVRWTPGPYGLDYPLVEEGFRYESNHSL